MMRKRYWLVLLFGLVALSGCVETYERPCVTGRGKHIYTEWRRLPQKMNMAVAGLRAINEALLDSSLQRAQRLSLEYNVAIDDYTHTINKAGAEWNVGLYDYHIEDTARWSDFRVTCVAENQYQWVLLPRHNDEMELSAELVTDSVDRDKVVQYYKVNGKGRQTIHDFRCQHTYIYQLIDVVVMRQCSLAFVGGKIDLAVTHAADNDTLSVSVAFCDNGDYDLTYLGQTDRYSSNSYYYE